MIDDTVPNHLFVKNLNLYNVGIGSDNDAFDVSIKWSLIPNVFPKKKKRKNRKQHL